MSCLVNADDRIDWGSARRKRRTRMCVQGSQLLFCIENIEKHVHLLLLGRNLMDRDWHRPIDEVDRTPEHGNVLSLQSWNSNLSGVESLSRTVLVGTSSSTKVGSRMRKKRGMAGSGDPRLKNLIAGVTFCRKFALISLSSLLVPTWKSWKAMNEAADWRYDSESAKAKERRQFLNLSYFPEKKQAEDLNLP